MLRIGGKHHKVGGIVILGVSVAVMDNFRGQQQPAQCLLGHKAMFGHIPLFGRMRMVWAVAIPIASHFAATAGPVGVTGSGAGSSPLCLPAKPLAPPLHSGAV